MADPERIGDDMAVIIQYLVDYLMPELTPYETSLYIYLLRHSALNGSSEVRVGKRTIAAGLGKGVRGEKTSYEHVSETLERLERKGCIKIGSVAKEGTLYCVMMPKDVPLVSQKLATLSSPNTEENYFDDTAERHEVFERDRWICQYCGERVTRDNATLDHFIPQCKGGKPTKDNLKTSCFVCNSLKSGRTLEEAAPLLLKAVQERKSQSHES